MGKYYNIREVTDLKDLINQTVELYGDKPAFKFKKRMYKKGIEETLIREITGCTKKEFAAAVGR